MIQVTNKHYLDTEYLTVAECLRRNGYRHYCNGMKYLERGMTKHAFGSFAKAQRNYDQSDKLDLRSPIISLPIFDKLNEAIAATIMYMDNGELILRTVTEQEMYKDG